MQHARQKLSDEVKLRSGEVGRSKSRGAGGRNRRVVGREARQNPAPLQRRLLHVYTVPMLPADTRRTCAWRVGVRGPPCTCHTSGHPRRKTMSQDANALSRTRPYLDDAVCHEEHRIRGVRVSKGKSGARREAGAKGRADGTWQRSCPDFKWSALAHCFFS